MEDAQKAIAEAEARTAEYADKLRQARAEVYKVREQRVKQWNAERDAALGRRPQGCRAQSEPGQGRARGRGRRGKADHPGLRRRFGRPGRPRGSAAAAGGSR